MSKKSLLYYACVAIAILVAVIFCSRPMMKQQTPATNTIHPVKNAIYYWRTVYRPSEKELEFLEQHHVGRMYLRMFDVIEGETLPEPNATVRFAQAIPKDMEIIPTVFITTDAIRRVETENDMEDLAIRIVRRITRICDWNGIEQWKEVQLDCDWTEHTSEDFFKLCRYVKKHLPEGKLLSCTIRLHQLRESPPPVDYGVLMVYNTDDFRNPKATNSILNDSTVETYLKNVNNYHLPMDIALPIYQWNLVYDKSGNFKRIAARWEWDIDSTETVKFESVPYTTLHRTQDLLYKYLHLKHGRFSTILYHLNETNINNYSHEEFKSIYNR